MNQVIIYTQDNGIVAIIIPTEEALAIYGLDAIAKKDVPSGKPYKIILDTEVPADRTQRGQWTVANADLTDGVGAISNEFTET
jgi:hypothetical protein